MRHSGRVVIFDRYVLDTIVDLRFSYAPDGRMPPQEMLVRTIVPTARCAFFIDVAPETAHGRKPDWSLEQTRVRADMYRSECRHLGVRPIDGQRPAGDITKDLMAEVLNALNRRHGG